MLIPWLVAVVAGAGVGVLQYGLRPGGSLIPALARSGAVTLIVALLLDAPIGRARVPRPFAALDASASWQRGADGDAWSRARARLRSAGADSTYLFGDSLRLAGLPPEAPADAASAVRPAVERALAAGRALVVVTDGEIDDPAALGSLPPGSRVEVVERAASPDAGVLALEAPRAAVGGDTVDVRVRVQAGAAGSGATALDLLVGDRRAARASLEPLAPFGERAFTFRLPVPNGDGERLLRAALAAGDAEPRNDSLTVALDVSAAAGAVFVSTSPDFDARYALGVLRGALSLPTRGYFRVAPGNWRADGSLAAVSEEEVRRAVRSAPLVVLHGDTAALGRPRDVTAGALALLAPPAEGATEWYATGAPASPIAAALAGVPWDSLPPIAIGATPPRGSWEGLEVRQGRRGDRRAPVVGIEGARRTVIVTASGLWRWQFRGGTSADAYATLWGSLFDWLAGERSDVRAALPADPVVRAGEAVRWRRGAGADSVVTVALVRRGGPGGEDSVTLRFGAGATVTESAPLAPGVYDVRVRGGTTLLAVNPSREWLPRQRTVRAGRVGTGAPLGDAPRLRSLGWAYAVALVLLCAEWLTRRRLGLR